MPCSWLNVLVTQGRRRVNARTRTATILRHTVRGRYCDSSCRRSLGVVASSLHRYPSGSEPNSSPPGGDGNGAKVLQPGVHRVYQYCRKKTHRDQPYMAK